LGTYRRNWSDREWEILDDTNKMVAKGRLKLCEVGDIMDEDLLGNNNVGVLVLCIWEGNRYNEMTLERS
jgi:hypothetical protein